MCFKIRLSVFLIIIISVYSCKKTNESCKDFSNDNIAQEGCLNGGINDSIGICKFITSGLITANGDGYNDRLVTVIDVDMMMDTVEIEGDISIEISHTNCGVLYSNQVSFYETNQFEFHSWDGHNQEGLAVPGIYQFKISGHLNGIPYNYSGNITVITVRTFFDYCNECISSCYDADDPLIDCSNPK